MIIRQVGLAMSNSFCTASRSMNRCRALTLAVGIFTSENGFSSISLCLRATCRNVRANDRGTQHICGQPLTDQQIMTFSNLLCDGGEVRLSGCAVSSPQNGLSDAQRFRMLCPKAGRIYACPGLVHLSGNTTVRKFPFFPPQIICPDAVCDGGWEEY